MRPLILFVLSFVILNHAHAAPKKPAPTIKNINHSDWLTIYIGLQKVGYKHTSVTTDKLNGKPVYRRDETIEMNFRQGRDNMGIEVRQTFYADASFTPISLKRSYILKFKDSEKTGSPLYFGDTVDVSYKGRSITITKKLADGQSASFTRRIPDEVNIAASCKYELGADKPLAPGKTLTMITMPLAIMFSDGKLSYNSIETCAKLKALPNEKIEIGGKTYNASVSSIDLMDDDPSHHLIIWRTEDGKVIKEEIKDTNAFCIREPQDTFLKGLDSHFPNLMGLEPDKPIDKPREVTHLKVRLLGINHPVSEFDDELQSSKYDPVKKTLECRVTARHFDAETSRAIGWTDKEYKKWTEDNDDIGSDDEIIRAKAWEIIGDETNAYKAACKIRKWVQENITLDPDESYIVSSAADILKSKKGVSGHLATLCVALSRAVGIPARISTGLYYNDDAFYSMAWAEVYVGEWVTLNPAIPDDFVDATHIKLYEGLPDSNAIYTGLTGGKAEILEIK